jgi:peptide/nickel transport system permease protein
MDQIANSLRKADSLIQAGNPEAACVILAKILRANPQNEQAWYLLSFAIQIPERQIYALRRTLRLNPDHAEAQARLAQLTGQSVVQKPTPVPMEEETVDPLDEAASLLKAGDVETAAAILRDALRTNPDHVQAWYLMSYAEQTQRGQINALRQTLRLNPDHMEAKARLAELTGHPVILKPTPARAKVKQWPLTSVAAPLEEKIQVPSNLFSRITKYTLVKGIMLLVTVVVAVYLTIIVANLGGYVDEIFKARIDQALAGRVMGGWLKDVPTEEKFKIIEQTRWEMEEASGLHEPFLLRTLFWLVRGLTLDLGESYLYYFFHGIMITGEESVQFLVLERLPYTLLLVGASNFLLFFASIFLALFLSRKYGGWLDRIMVPLAALNTAPSWIYGIVLIVIMAGHLRILPFPKVIDLEFAELTPRFISLLLGQMILPVGAIFLSVFFQGVYVWRTFFVLYSKEDYVEMAEAKGLSSNEIERRYILRPTLPYVITNFVLMMITIWEGAIALELLFYWPGIGPLFMNAAYRFDTEVIVAVVIVFAYLLAISVFLLDIIYAWVDPRVRIAGGEPNYKTAPMKGKKRYRLWWSSLTSRMRRQVPTPRIKPSRHTPSKRTRSLNSMENIRRSLNRLKPTLAEIRKYPLAIAGGLLILALIVVSIYTMIALPYNEVVTLWRAHGSEQLRSAWIKNPRSAMPAWVNYFRRDKLPESFLLSTEDDSVVKDYEIVSNDMTEINFSFAFDYPYDDFPDEITLFFEAEFSVKKPHITFTWLTPDGRELDLGSMAIKQTETYRLSQDERLQRKFKDLTILEALFRDPNVDVPEILKGRYELRVQGFVFEPDSEINAEFVLYGKVFGFAGTDSNRRDLTLALLWGAPVALAFGLIGAIGTNLFAMMISAVGAWYGGWVDNIIQRITEVNIIMPTLPIAIMVFIMYSKSIWVILGVIVLLNIFGGAIKNYRAAFLQVKQAAFIEGAQAYGAGNWRIIRRYMVPRIVPILIPQLVIMVPGYVFYEATLAYLGVSDPSLPTWGKVIYEAITNGALQGYYYWILEPITLLILTGLAFATFGFALDRIINPRLREA